ncbi:MAG: cytochrome c [Gemmatimonadetes bacterium]|nr:cytochrome c [Gemmatimonadota bacterium]
MRAKSTKQPAVAGGRQLVRRLAPALLLTLGACEWFTDFKRTPMVTTWESDSILKVRGAPQGSVPTNGTAVSALQVSYMGMPATLDSVAALASNPTAMSAASLANGRKYYQINCAVCHGQAGAGDGTAAKYGMIPMPLTSDAAKGRSDGYIFAIMRNGRGAMPPYNRIEEMDRWDVVNYVRALQGQAAGVAFETGPLALPGVTGDKVPGATRLGPNRWAPHAGAPRPAAPAPSDSNAAAPQGAH